MNAKLKQAKSAPLWLTMIIAVAVIGSAFSVVYAKHYNRTTFSELQTLYQQRDEINIQYGQLQIEQSMHSADNELERIAARKLDMTLPTANQVVMVKHE